MGERAGGGGWVSGGGRRKELETEGVELGRALEVGRGGGRGPGWGRGGALGTSLGPVGKVWGKGFRGRS